MVFLVYFQGSITCIVQPVASVLSNESVSKVLSKYDISQ